jgi:ABC-type Mn2+/Zn2+ transport system ATPase subunit
VNAITLRGVSLARGERVVLSDVDAAIAAGEFIGILGPNGSGKTTLLQAILGLVRPIAGEIRVFDQPPRSGVAAIGYLPQKRSAIADLAMRGRDFVGSAVRGDRWGLPRLGPTDRADIAQALALVEGEALAERPLSQLSGGELQRLLLAKALLGRPKLLLLDEPLMSLDLRFQAGVVALVRRVQQSQATQIVGILLVFALMVGPAAAALRLSSRFRTALALSVLFALLQTWLGIALAYVTDWPPSFWITFLSFLTYAASLLGTHSWRARARTETAAG